ncbi:MAG TPA: DUF1501 domain-containing protein [Gemmataceae bacterium]|nr:DUF1501 domain-containing protein [Gemmataceae bacterium]
MLTVPGRPQRFCDGIPRRSFLKIGAFAFGAAQFSLVDVLRAEESIGKSSHKAVINVFLGGGPPHQDMWDIKTEAPSEIRGEFKPIATKVPGIQIGECFPRIAASADQFTFIRSIVGARGGHDAVQCTTGRSEAEFRAMGGWPSMGSLLAKIAGPVDPSVPPFVGLAATTKHVPWSDAGKPGFLGAPFAAFKPEGNGLGDMKLNGINQAQLGDRKKLLASFDNLRRGTDSSFRGTDAAKEKALDVLMSSKLLDALDISREPEKLRARYGDGKPYKYQFDGAPTCSEQLLMARRLVEAGARCVTLSFGRWDSHGKNFDLVRDHGAKLDQGITALVEDLDARGMLNDLTVIAWGEFGRTPRINKEAGRDHWPQVSCALMAGGGLRHGQVIGSTNRLGEFAANRPVTFGEVFATIWHALGINPETTTIADPTGRPQHLVDARAMRELV